MLSLFLLRGSIKIKLLSIIQLPGLIDKDSASENNEKKIATEESYLDEAEGKNIKEAVSELDLDYKSGETNITKEKTKVIAPGEKVR